VADGIPVRDAALGYAWAWLENQIVAGVKLIPLGQTAGQRLQRRLAGAIAAAVDQALQLPDEALGASLPALAIASSRHEAQYTRLFRS
jgi:urease accessory protein